MLASALTGCSSEGAPSGIPQDLDLSGAIAGHVASAMLAGACGVPANLGQAYATQLTAKVGAEAFTYYAEIRNWQGVGDYPPVISDRNEVRFPSVTVTVGKRTFNSLHGDGSLTVDAGAKSGRVDMSMTQDGSAAGARERIVGSWRCR
jgi:hypothetical protein